MAIWERLLSKGINSQKSLLALLPSRIKIKPIIWKDKLDALTNQMSQLLNRATGYEIVEGLRDRVLQSQREYAQLREALLTARASHGKAIEERSRCQKELNGLLQRKPSWTVEDVSRFTELYRREIALEAEEATAKTAHEQLEGQMDQAHAALIGSLCDRYQEEQVWSDKIRRASTMGTFALMLGNLALFAILQVWVEPAKRRRFVHEFEQVLERRLAAVEAVITYDAVDQKEMESVPNTAPEVRDRVLPKSFIEGAAYGAIASLLLVTLSNKLI